MGGPCVKTQMRRIHGLCTVSLALLLVLAGCSAPFSNPSANTPVGAAPGGPGDPPSDRLGWEAGYWYNESIDVDQSDGLSDAEMDAFVGRAMARVERIRSLEFEKRVPVSVLTRDEYRNRSGGNPETGNETFSAWNNQVWEALFISGESADSQQAISQTRGSSVAGFYSSTDDEIKIITENKAETSIDNATLVHELTHALQDQHYNLSAPRFTAPTQDESLAIDGIVEGSASYVEKQYARRCGQEWACVDTPSSGGSAAGDGGARSGGGPNLGVLITIYQPYSDGPVYVHNLVERGGWAAVDRVLRNPPESTEQTIHSTDENPVPIEFTSRAQNGWETFPKLGVNGSDTVGEASMYAMFWYQARQTGANTVNPRAITNTPNPYDTYNYSAPPTAGWGNDRVFPYRKDVGSDTKYGYVWKTRWDTPKDARQFRRAYLEMIRAHDATRRPDGTYVIPDGPFADAFRIHQQGSRVVIVNGPTPRAVENIRPGLAS